MMMMMMMMNCIYSNSTLEVAQRHCDTEAAAYIHIKKKTTGHTLDCILS